MKRIGVLGGSFNPIHNSHLRIVSDVLRKKLVDEVWIVPCKNHPFDKKLESIHHRMNMIKISIKDMPKVRVSDIESGFRGKNYTIKTIERLKKKFPRNEFVLIIGADVLQDISSWKDFDKLAENVGFILCKRKSYSFKKIKKMKFVGVSSAGKGISSTEVRARIKSKKDICSLVPVGVCEYIFKNRIYH